MSVGEVIKLKEEPFLLRQRGGKNSVPYTVGTSILLGSFFEGSNIGFAPVVLFFSGGGLFRRGRERREGPEGNGDSHRRRRRRQRRIRGKKGRDPADSERTLDRCRPTVYHPSKMHRKCF